MTMKHYSMLVQEVVNAIIQKLEYAIISPNDISPNVLFNKVNYLQIQILRAIIVIYHICAATDNC